MIRRPIGSPYPRAAGFLALLALRRSSRHLREDLRANRMRADVVSIPCRGSIPGIFPALGWGRSEDTGEGFCPQKGSSELDFPALGRWRVRTCDLSRERREVAGPLLLPPCDCDGARLPSARGSHKVGVVRMRRTQRVRPSGASVCHPERASDELWPKRSLVETQAGPVRAPIMGGSAVRSRRHSFSRRSWLRRR